MPRPLKRYVLNFKKIFFSLKTGYYEDIQTQTHAQMEAQKQNLRKNYRERKKL